MERTVITLQSLLVLLATFHVATGCMCSKLYLEDAMCNPDTGPKEIELNEDVFSTASVSGESICDYTLEYDVDYLLVGTVNHVGELSTNLCWLLPWEDLSESQVSLLERTGPAPNCLDKDEIMT
ncbi:hypothetical protein ACJMK2_032930 [Sinanodonta woodiana]|uniref:NTR domain-containing protein n=1 Tax=Sinanodonta woodiana TaxID=1069815 RepID=A0ABD3X4S6_SINWO